VTLVWAFSKVQESDWFHRNLNPRHVEQLYCTETFTFFDAISMFVQILYLGFKSAVCGVGPTKTLPASLVLLSIYASGL